jgi:hypothetical protein
MYANDLYDRRSHGRPREAFLNSEESLKYSRGIIFLWAILYLLFPNDDQLSSFGFGPPGARVLIGDVFFFLVIVCALKKLKYGIAECIKIIGWFPLVVFLGSTAFSIVRGISEFGGGAIGDSRWFFGILLMPVGYLIYAPKYLPTIKKIFITAAVVHSLMVLVRYFTGVAWDTGGDIIRFAAGRPSLIISIGCVCLLFKGSLSDMRLKGRILRGGLLVLFLSALVLGQTRTIFIMLPVAFVLILWNLNALRLTSVLKVLVTLALVIVVGMTAVKTLLPGNIQNSLYANLEVFGEVFKSDTYTLLLNSEDSSLSAESINAKNQFSRSGNTYFRILAWSQIINSITEYPGGWFIGLPMGTPFYWFGTGKKLYENLLPHNDYLAIVARVGALGLIGYFLILLKFFIMTRRFAVSMKRINNIPEGLVIFITVLIFLLLFVAINAELRAYASHFWVWLLLGFGIKILRSKGSLRIEKGGLVRRILIQVSKQPVGTAKEAV